MPSVAQTNIENIKFTPELQNKFLRWLKKTGNVSIACQKTGIGRTTAYLYKKELEWFSETWEAVLESATDKLERSVYEKALNGTKKGVYYQGDKIGEEIEHHDQLAMFYLKANRAEKYGDKSKIEHSGGIAIQVQSFVDQSVTDNKTIDVTPTAQEQENPIDTGT